MNTKESGGGEDVRETLRHFVTRSINLPDLADDDDLFESGLVNSLFAIQLMTFIEKTFGVEVEADDLDIGNFRSLNAATSFVLKKSVATTS
jgi:methoxymalonate biosynthesis acyl carrier protein